MSHFSERVGNTCMTVLLSLLLFLSLTVGEARTAVHFRLLDATQLSLHQTAQVEFSLETEDKGMRLSTDDTFYFVKQEDAETCRANSEPSGAFKVLAVDSDKHRATATFTVRSDIFSVGERYGICYVSGGISSPARRTDLEGDATGLEVWPSVYRDFSLRGQPAAGGLGDLYLTVTETKWKGRPTNGGIGVKRTIVLLPCEIEGECDDAGRLSERCGQANANAIKLGNLQGVGSSRVTGTFSLPPATVKRGFAICVPYCSRSNGECTDASLETVSYTTVVDRDREDRGALITFDATNSNTYSTTPPKPQAREEGQLVLHGGVFTSRGDKVVIVRKDMACSASAQLLNNLKVGAVTVHGNGSATVKFVTKTLIDDKIEGRVCYFNHSSGEWSEVHRMGAAGDPQKAFFVIDVLQPTSFKLNTGEATIGQRVVIDFIGTGLEASLDSAFLSLSTCQEEKEEEGVTKFDCTLTGGYSPKCTVTVDPESNVAQTAKLCYRKGDSPKAAELGGSIHLAERNPIFDLKPYPLRGGQKGTMTFYGQKLSRADTVYFTSPDTPCDDDQDSRKFRAVNVREDVPGVQYTYDVLGEPNQCLRVCYLIRLLHVWSVARPQGSLTPEVANCSKNHLYVSEYDLNYELPTEEINAMETAVVKLSSASPMPSEVKVVRSMEACVFNFCVDGNRHVSACELPQDVQDYVSSVYQNAVTLFVGSPNVNYILCAKNGADTHAPVLPVGVGANAAHAIFKAGRQAVNLLNYTPEVWRVGEVLLNSTFKGKGLNKVEDKVYVFAGGDMLGGGTKVCPPLSNLPRAILSSTVISGADDATTVVATHRGSHELYTEAVVHLCYVWSKGGRITYTGSIKFAASHPSSVTTTPEEGLDRRAGRAVELLFRSNTSDLKLGKVDVYFYKFPTASGPRFKCFCDEECPKEDRKKYKDGKLVAGSSESSTVWTNLAGFDNHGFPATYVVCYASPLRGSITYMGEVAVGMAQPTFYEAVSDSGTYYSGKPITITVTQQCEVSPCIDLTEDHRLALIPENSRCHDLNEDIWNKVPGVIGGIKVTTKTYEARVVANESGQYRVCYGIEMVFVELPRTEQYDVTPLLINDAEPSGFTTVPEEPSEGQLLTVNLDCDDRICSSCSNVRLVPGVSSTCWQDVSNAFSSNNCQGLSTSVAFHGVHLPEGSYTVCYGDIIEQNHRVPGTLSVGSANPSSFTSSSYKFPANLYTTVRVEVDGVDLTLDDEICLLPRKGVYCHNLTNPEKLPGGVLGAVLNKPTKVHGVEAASDRSRATWEFVADVYFDKKLIHEDIFCENPGVSCSMQLCYRRRDMTWARVPDVKESEMTLLAANPAKVSFDITSASVGMYSMATVSGTQLDDKAELTVHKGNCGGEVVMTKVGTPVVDGTKEKWVSVVRFNKTSSEPCVACYTNKQEVVRVDIDVLEGGDFTVLGEERYYELGLGVSPSHLLSQYELLGVSLPPLPGESQAETVELVKKEVECNYKPFYDAHEGIPAFEVGLRLEKNDSYLFIGRLAVPPSTYVLCVNVSTALFRVQTTREKDELTVITATPREYSIFPRAPFVGLPIDFTFFSDEEAPLSGKDSIRLIHGSLYDCGAKNKTSLGDYKVKPTETEEGPATIAVGVTIPDEYIGKALTVCYHRDGGSYSTVRRGGELHQNIEPLAPVPRSWSSHPTQAQDGRTLVVTFVGDGSNGGMLSDEDKPSLIRVASDAGVAPSCGSEGDIKGGSVVLQGVNAQWTIPPQLMKEGKYIVCYNSSKFGSVLRVKPDFLVVHRMQSPTDIVIGEGDSFAVFEGERFYMKFKSEDDLNPELVFDRDSGDPSRDEVLLSKTVECTSPLTRTNVAVIPKNFSFAEPGGNVKGSYLHLVVRGYTERFYICMRRADRKENEMFFDFEAIGDVAKPAFVTVIHAPISSFTIDPEGPRAGVPGNTLDITYTEGSSSENFRSFFFVKSMEGEKVEHDLINNCFRPRKDEVAPGSDVPLLDDGLRVDVPTGVMSVPFKDGGDYDLCFIAKGEEKPYAAATYAQRIKVKDMSPRNFTTGAILPLHNPFNISFISTDPIFTTEELLKHEVKLVVVEDSDPVGDNEPTCAGRVGVEDREPFEGERWTRFSDYNASWATIIGSKSQLFVCFLVSGQTMHFPVPNSDGGFLFSVGYSGARRYSVKPAFPYMGQELNITVMGSRLASDDRIKVIDVTGMADDTVNDTTCFKQSYEAISVSPSGVKHFDDGKPVHEVSSSQTWYQLRINKSGKFIVCYKNTAVSHEWGRLRDPSFFMVGEPHPTKYSLNPAVVYETEETVLTISDTEVDLTPDDRVKLVEGSTETNPFVCTKNTVGSAAIKISRNASDSNNNRTVSRLCAEKAVNVTLCYLLKNGTWAEVPLLSSPGKYEFNSIMFSANPFSELHIEPSSPRPFERFHLTFNSAVGATASTVKFAQGKQERCTKRLSLIEPVFYSKNDAPNNFSVALGKHGEYQVYIGPIENNEERLIAHDGSISMTLCDPCTFEPSLGFLGSYITLEFHGGGDGARRGGKGGLSREDTIILVIYKEEMRDRYPCDALGGPLASEPKNVTSFDSESDATIFTFYLPNNESYLGDYHICYRKAKSNSGYTLVPRGDNLKDSTFSLYPPFRSTMSTCPSPLSFLQRATFTLSYDTDIYSKVVFTKRDAFFLLPNATECADDVSTDTEGVMQPIFDNSNSGTAEWHISLPSGHYTTAYKVCIKPQHSEKFIELMPEVIRVNPQNPIYVSSIPPLHSSLQEGFTMQIHGENLHAGDKAYLVDAGVLCEEKCDEVVTPPGLPGVKVETQYVNNKLMRLTADTGPNNTNVALCYRPHQGRLVRLAAFYMQGIIPFSYSPSFKPRVGTRPSLTFKGRHLSVGDRMVIVKEGWNCDPSLSAAVGKFSSLGADSHWATFVLPLVNVSEGAYTVCYNVKGNPHYVQMSRPFVVGSGGPSEYELSNTPMQGRAMELSFPDGKFKVSPGDSVMIACATCSCFDETSAKLPYGLSYVNISEGGAPFKLRIGMDDGESYPVCYRIEGSGFAQVGTRFITPTPGWPNDVEAFPSPIHEGQRAVVTAVGRTSESIAVGEAVHNMSNRDGMAIVLAGKLCWDRLKANDTGVLSFCENVSATDDVRADCELHIPSVGPDKRPETDFPLSYTVCYRQAGQDDFVAVVSTTHNLAVQRANPLSMETYPPHVSRGMRNISMMFPNASEGDTAYIVKFEGDEPSTGTPCNDKAATVSELRTAFPEYLFGLPSDLEKKTLVVCYTRNGTTVAEVPEPLKVYDPVPSVWETEPHPRELRFRQYFNISFKGVGLNSTEDSVVFSDKPCDLVESFDKVSEKFHQRVGRFVADGESGNEVHLKAVAQLVAYDNVPEVHVCYRRRTSWISVGRPFSPSEPLLREVVFTPIIGRARAGHRIYISHEEDQATKDMNFAVVSADDSDAQSWCHNYTSEGVLEPHLRRVDAYSVEIPVWQTVGNVRLCAWRDGITPSDVSLTPRGKPSELDIEVPNPTLFKSDPYVPRVGQSVNLTFQLLMKPTEGDFVRIVQPDDTLGCSGAQPVEGLDYDLIAKIMEGNMTQVTLINTLDKWNYSSFEYPGRFWVCYYSVGEKQWNLIGGKNKTGEINVMPMVPRSWNTEKGTEPHAGEVFVLVFRDPEGVLNAENDLAWAVPKNKPCGVNLDPDCLDCIRLPLDRTRSSSEVVYTDPSVSFMGGEFSVCYHLGKATPVRFSRPLKIKSNGVSCLVQTTVTAGELQNLTFHLDGETDIGDDIWGVSTYDSTPFDCNDNLDPAFVYGRSGHPIGRNKSKMVYTVEWPASMMENRYRICFNNSGVGQAVCPCSQFLPWGGECFLTVLQPKVKVETQPKPIYAGQTLKLNFMLTNASGGESINDVKLMKYDSGLTTCNDGDDSTNQLFGEGSVKKNLAEYYMEIQLNHTLQYPEFIICANLSGSSHLSHVGMSEETVAPHTLNVRPYLTLETSPKEKEMIRAGRTLEVMFRHVSDKVDDVIGEGDLITFTKNPYECREANITEDGGQSVSGNFDLRESSFSKLPGRVENPNNESKSSRIIATFQNEAEVGEWYVCYKLQRGTWAPVLPPLNLLKPAVASCSYSAKARWDTGEKKSWRALQYVKTTIYPAAGTGDLLKQGDKLRVVPRETSCFRSNGTIFETAVTMKDDTITAMTRVQETGDYKLCYLYDGATNGETLWTPVCEGFEVERSSPRGTYGQCLRPGPMLTFAMIHNDGHTFKKGERFRFVSRNEECVDINDVEPVSKMVKINGTEQAAAGTVITSESASFKIPPVHLAEGTESLRLCYKDTDGGHFLVPFEVNEVMELGVDVASRLIPSVAKQESIVVGERVLLSFVAATQDPGRADTLQPYETNIPDPYEYGPEFNGSFDAATAIALQDPASSREGHCFMRNALGKGVYGNATTTVGAFDPIEKGTYVSCYTTVRCGVEDVDVFFRVHGPTPSNWTASLSAVRQGQLFDVTFERNMEEVDSPELSGGDNFAMLKEGRSCWEVTEGEAGVVEVGRDQTTARNLIIPPEQPSANEPQELRFLICYRLKAHTWTRVTDRDLVVLPANPAEFVVRNSVARIMQVNTIEFHGSSLGKDDHVKIIERGKSCTSDSTPPEGMEAFPQGDGAPIPGTSHGWRVMNATESKTVLSVGFVKVGTYSVCYRLGNESVWTLMYGELTAAPRIPAAVTQTPATAAEGELFTLNFSAGEEPLSSGDRLSDKDQVRLYVGKVSCASPGKDPEVIATSPSGTDLLPQNVTFQMASGTRGEQTLCYVRSGTVVWGFETATIRPNPWNLTIQPTTVTTLRANQLINALFAGFGLVAGPDGKTDEVRFVIADGQQNDEACTRGKQEGKVHYYPLVANGTYSLQTVFVKPRWTGVYWVCYKLNGGKFHVMPNGRLEVIDPDPFHALSTKGNTVMDGELTKWFIQSSSPIPETALVFYSTKLCNDFMYYENPSDVLEKFPHDVAFVKDSIALLRARKATEENTILSLCYFHDGVTSLLVKEAMQVKQGIPPVLKTPVPAMAWNIFNFTLRVTHNTDDYVALVEDPDTCAGSERPPRTSDLFSFVDHLDGEVVVTTAVAREGTYYICYSHPEGECKEDNSRECARVVGTVVAIPPDPSEWSMNPLEAYTTDLLQIRLTRQSIVPSPSLRGLASAISGESLWLALLPETAETIGDVALICMSTMHGGGIAMERNQFDMDMWSVRVTVSGSYALCFMPLGLELPSIFPPFIRKGPVILPSVVNNVTNLMPPTLGTKSLFMLDGRGLTTNDEVVAVKIPANTVPTAVCANNAGEMRVNGTFAGKEGEGLRALLVEFQFAILGKYVICYKSNTSKGNMTLVTRDPFDVQQTALTYTVLGATFVNTTLTLQFHGVGLANGDEAAVVALTEGNGDELCTNGEFTRVKEVSATGATALHTSVPKEAGAHAVCFKGKGSPSLRLPGEFVITSPEAIAAKFITLPKCNASKRCSVQPVIALVNSSGEASTDPDANAVMRLKHEDGTEADDLLTGSKAYRTNYSIFWFTELVVSEPGSYIMEAHFVLSGGTTTFAPVNVNVEKEENPVDPATLSCSPNDIIERTILPDGSSDERVNISCKITAGPNGSPTSYKVEVSAGSSTNVTSDGAGSGPQTYSFTVLPPYADRKIQRITITVTSSQQTGSLPVINSPITVLIGSRPGAKSVLACKSNTVDVTQSGVLRQNDQLRCSAQGRSTIDGLEQDVIAFPKYFHFVRQYDNDASTRKNITISDYPDTEGGMYFFNVSVQERAQAVSVLGSVATGDDDNGHVPIQGSPVDFAVIGEPKPGASGVVCTSEGTGSSRWFLPLDQLRCTLVLAAGDESVVGIPQDFEVKTPSGSDMEPDDLTAWGSNLSYSGAAPPIPTGSLAEKQQADLGLTYAFLHKPSNIVIASTTATLVFVRSLVVRDESNSTFTSLTLTGSGLDVGHQYGAKRTPNCEDGVETNAIVKPDESGPHSLLVLVNYGGGKFYLCFAPADQKNSWAKLANGVVDYSPPADDDTDKWFYLLIGGITLLVALLVLLVVLIWYLCKGVRRTSEMVKDAVYMRPRLNDRFTSVAPVNTASQVLKGSENMRPLASKKATGRGRNTGLGRSTTKENESADASTVYPIAERPKPQPSPNVCPELVKPKVSSTTNPDAQELKTASTHTCEMTVIPPVPAPRPPTSEVSASNESLQKEMSTTSRQPFGSATTVPTPRSKQGQRSNSSAQSQCVQLGLPRQSYSLPSILPAENTTTTDTKGDNTTEAQSWVGPFMVMGYTSRPLAKTTQSTEDLHRNQPSTTRSKESNAKPQHQ